MIGKLIGGLVGAKLAKDTPGGLDGPRGALIGMAVPFVLRRLSPMGMVALAVGGYAYKKYNEKNAAPATRAKRTVSPRKRTSPKRTASKRAAAAPATA